MNTVAQQLVWLFILFILTLIGAFLIHPAVILGTIIGVSVTTMKQIYEEKENNNEIV
jgi:hypothetical protein